MSKTIDDFRNFFRPAKAKRDFGIEETVEDALTIIGQQLRNHDISVEFHSDGKYIINGYQNEFIQTILILLSNAQDAILDNHIDKPTIDIFVEAHGDDNVQISVQDNAGGVPSEILDRVFEPYFTTKEQGKGMGIGLYMAKEIVERQMGGVLSVENSGSGAIFKIIVRQCG